MTVMNEPDDDYSDLYVPTRYQFECHTVCEDFGGRAEVWATRIPIHHLRPVDVGCLISVKWHPSTIAAGTNPWSRLDQLPARSPKSFKDHRMTIWVSGVEWELPDTHEVWLGYEPGSPTHMQRGGFER